VAAAVSCSGAFQSFDSRAAGGARFFIDSAIVKAASATFLVLEVQILGTYFSKPGD